MQRLSRGTKLVVASHNPGKVWEIRELIAPYGLEAVSAGDLGLPVPKETETTFEGNACLKAVAAATASGLPALADDSGLEVTALAGAPGVYSADWAGPSRDFGLAMARVHDELERRGAWSAPTPPAANFVSVLCLAWPGGEQCLFKGEVHGNLVWPPRGGNGFGYDPMFVAQGQRLTFGEMEPAGKYAISHRTRAFDKFRRECLEETADDAAPAAAPGFDAEALSAAAENLSTRPELVRFISNLRRDLAKRGDGFEASDLARYLAEMEAWLAGNDIADEPRWRSIARVLLAASRYK